MTDVEYQTNALILPDDLTYERYCEVLDALDSMERGHQWWIGDALNHGEAHYGDKYTQAEARLHLSYVTLRSYAWVANSYENVSSRISSVPWSLHREAAALPEEMRTELLAEAGAALEEDPHDDEWTEVKFRARVKRAKSGYRPDANGYTEHEPTPEEQTRLTHGDRLDVALFEDSPWPSGEVDLLVTSPPYGVGKDYLDGGDYTDWDSYVDVVQQWAREIHRVLNVHHGRAAINVPIDRSANAGLVGRPSYQGRPIYATWVTALLNAGLEYRSTILWNDRQAGLGTQRGSIDSPAAPHVVCPCETVILVYRDSWSRSSERAHDLSHELWLNELGPRGLWLWDDITGEADRSEHPAPWPDELPERLIRLLSFRGDTIADPMCGTGKAGAIAARLGRKVWLADRSEQYVALAREALSEARGVVVEEAA